MSNSTFNGKLSASISSLCLLALVGVACKLSSLPGAKMNMFESTNAQDGAAKVKAKLGVDAVKVSRIEIHEDRMSIVIQDPAKPKNYDEYTYEKGVLSGPKPVQAMVIGNNELSADKMPLFDLNSTNLGAVADVCRKVIERAKVEDGKCELISVNWESARWTRTKEENDKLQDEKDKEFQRKMMAGKIDPNEEMRKSLGDLAVTWRVYVRGPRATKDFWVDLKGNVFDYH
jgi:hypothetical protein